MSAIKAGATTYQWSVAVAVCAIATARDAWFASAAACMMGIAGGVMPAAAAATADPGGSAPRSRHG
jgi:hypothetical protein